MISKKSPLWMDDSLLKHVETVRIDGNAGLEDWRQFSTTHAGHPALKDDVIYALPAKLIDAIVSEPKLKTFFSDDDLAFEHDLAALAGGGFFLQRPFQSTFRSDHLFDEVRRTDRELRRSHLSDHATSIKRDLRAERPDRLQAASRDIRLSRWGFAGWLVTDPVFRAERDAFRNRWRKIVGKLGGFPPRPSIDKPFRVKDKYSAFYTDYMALLNRWGLECLETWDLVVPLTALHLGPGRSVDPSFAVAGFTLWVPAYQLREEQSRLSLMAEFYLETMPDHLRGWVQERSKQWGTTRFARLLNLFICLELALRSRYSDRMRRCTEKLDNAIARSLSDDPKNSGTGMSDSIKKIRLMLSQRLRACAANAR